MDMEYPNFKDILHSRKTLMKSPMAKNNDFTKQANIKRTKSKLWYYITRVNNNFKNILTRDFTHNEIRRAIINGSNNKAVGADFTPSELFETNIASLPTNLEKSPNTIIALISPKTGSKGSLHYCTRRVKMMMT